MELKYYQSPVKMIANLGSNRTFMELKWAYYVLRSTYVGF